MTKILSPSIPPDEPLDNRLREVRVAAGLSQQELAEQAGLTRQTVNAVEGGKYLPNTTVALRLAQVLGCRVEDLFRLKQDTPRRPVELWGKTERGPVRVALGRLRGRLVAHPLLHGFCVTEGFQTADGVLDSPPTGARLLVDPEQLEGTAFLMGCDPGLSILTAHLERSRPEVRLVWLPAASRSALNALARGGAHIGGCHIKNAKTGEFNVGQAREALAATGGLLVAFASWEQGLMVRRGNPKKLRSAEDLTRKGVRFVNRESGSGSRELFDGLLTEAGIPRSKVNGYETAASSHLAVARTVAAGGADAGIGLRAVAHACGLDFVPLAAIRFDLAIPSDLLEHRAVATMLELLQTRRLKEDLAALPGYDVSRIGTVVDRFEAATA